MREKTHRCTGVVEDAARTRGQDAGQDAGRRRAALRARFRFDRPRPVGPQRCHAGAEIWTSLANTAENEEPTSRRLGPRYEYSI